MRSFDVAIIGAGSAGCALAGRLARRTTLRTVIIEAGPDYGPLTDGRWPTDLVDARHTPDCHDWGFTQSRARVVGGCSAHNECGIVFALPGDYDRWGVAGWSDMDLAPIVADVADALPLRRCTDDALTGWQRAFRDAALAEGFRRLPDVNDAPGTPGVAPFTQNIRDGLRWNAAFAFLDAARSRVATIAETLADRFVLERGRARSLIVRGTNDVSEIRAEQFVLSAGVYGSAAILLRSGVGPADHLTRLRIPVVIDLPGVGANLHDHPRGGVRVHSDRPCLPHARGRYRRGPLLPESGRAEGHARSPRVALSGAHGATALVLRRPGLLSTPALPRPNATPQPGPGGAAHHRPRIVP